MHGHKIETKVKIDIQNQIWIYYIYVYVRFYEMIMKYVYKNKCVQYILRIFISYMSTKIHASNMCLYHDHVV